MSLRSRVLIGFAAVAVVLVLAAGITTRSTRSHLLDQVDRRLAAADAGDLGLERPRPGTPRRLSEFYGGIVTAEGVRTLITPDLPAGLPEPAIDARRVVAAANAGRFFTVGAVEGDLRYRVRAAPAVGGQFVVFALPLADVDATVDRLLGVEIAATLAVVALLAAVAWWVIHLGVRPVKRMTATALAIADGDLAQRVPDGAPGTEAGELGTALNRMLGTIEASIAERDRSQERLRTFVADASHELRTPVTTIRGYAELYRTGALDDPTELAEAMRRTEQEAVRMGTLVEDMLQLARLDQGRPLAREPVDLGAVVRDAARDASAVDPGRPITTDTDGAVVVTGDEHRLRQVVANIVGNALVHTDAGTPLSLRTGHDAATAWIEIADAGPGMPPDVAERVFERFYRADPARSRHRGGSGLGLAIVDSTVAAHGGTVRLATAPGQGTTVRVELPWGNPPPALSEP